MLSPLRPSCHTNMNMTQTINLSLWVTLLTVLSLGLYIHISRRFSKIPALPAGLLMLYCTIRLMSSLLKTFFPLGADGTMWIKICESIVLSWAIARLALACVLEIPLKLQGKKPLPRITRDFILFVCYSILFFIILRIRSDIDVVSLVTTSAVLTVVVGLAAQSMLSNFFYGLVLQIERPFDIGDWIQLGDHAGVVVGINWKSTRILTREQVSVYIPNSEITSRTFSNFSKPDRKVIASMIIGLDYESPPNHVKHVILQALHHHDKVLKHPRPEVWLKGFGDSSIQYEIRFCHNNFSTEPKIKSDIYMNVWYALKRHHITIPFPVRDIRHPGMELRRQTTWREKRCKDILSMFDRVSVLSPLSASERSQLASRVTIDIYGQGEYIVRQQEPGDSMYIIFKGSCDVLWEISPGEIRHMAVLNPGDFFGEMSLLTGEPRSASVCAKEDTEVFMIEKSVFSDILSANSGICDYLGEVLATRQKQLAQNSSLPSEAESIPISIIRKIKSFLGIP